jgi:hypothetical protein
MACRLAKSAIKRQIKVENMKIIRQLGLSLVLLLVTFSAYSEQSESEQEQFSQAELEQILAPIALYPDTVLSHILIASTYPLEVIQAERWLDKNPGYEGSEAVEAVEDQEWDPSVKALTAFPQILKRLSENLDWTQRLGDAFLQDEEALLASVQSLRARAYEAGNLDDLERVTVTREQDSIVIEPIEREVVYVPYYDTRVVYGSWHWSHYPPVYWSSPHFGYHHNGHHSPFYWGPRVRVSFGFFFSSFHWHNHHLVRIPRRHYRPHHYYDRHQIVRHQHARRWAHNPTHRRGVSYRSVTVRDRYRSNRPSRNEVRQHREHRVDSSNSRTHRSQLNQRDLGSTTRSQRATRDTRIATPNRIKEELRDGRISVQERNTRPVTSKPQVNNRSSNRKPRESRRPETVTRKPREDRSSRAKPQRQNERQAKPRQRAQKESRSPSKKPAKSSGNRQQSKPPKQRSSKNYSSSSNKKSSASSNKRSSSSSNNRSSSRKSHSNNRSSSRSSNRRSSSDSSRKRSSGRSRDGRN